MPHDYLAVRRHPASRLRPEHVSKVRRWAALGLPARHIASLLGVTDGTFYHWLSRGDVEPGSLYDELRTAYTLGEAQFVARHLRGLTRLAQSGNERIQLEARKFLLERRGGPEFSPRLSGELHTAVTIHAPQELQHLQPVFSDDQLAAMSPDALRAALLALPLPDRGDVIDAEPPGWPQEAQDPEDDPKYG